MEHLRTLVQLAFRARTRSLRRVAGHRPRGSVRKSAKMVGCSIKPYALQPTQMAIISLKSLLGDLFRGAAFPYARRNAIVLSA